LIGFLKHGFVKRHRFQAVLPWEFAVDGGAEDAGGKVFEREGSAN